MARESQLLYEDVGRFAMAKGYDAIKVPGMGYMVVLNRTKLHVQEESQTANFDEAESRDEHGRWTKSFDVKETATFREYIGNPDRKVCDRSEGDRYLRDLANELGMGDKPRVVSKEEMDGLIESGWTELERGAPRRFQEQLKGGDYYAYPGAYGSGIYTAYGKEIGQTGPSYASQAVDGVVARMALDKSAKVIDHDEVHKLMHAENVAHEDKEFGPLSDEIKAIKDKQTKALETGDDKEADRLAAEWRSKKSAHRMEGRLLYEDEGRWAMAHGYDAVRVPHEKYLVVLNRSKLAVQETYV